MFMQPKSWYRRGQTVCTHTTSTYSGFLNQFSVAWSPDGTRIASGSMDVTVQVWKAI